MRYFLLVVLVLVLLGGLAGGVYAYDKSNEDKIAKGVTVGGVAIGGMTPTEARATLRRVILDPLEQPLVVHHDKSTWTLGPKEARIATDLNATVDDALARSRRGNLFERAWREIRGRRIDASLKPTVTYSDAAIVRMLDKIRHGIERPAKDAKVTIDGTGVRHYDSRTGLRVRAADLHRRLRAAVTDPRAGRTFVAHTQRVQPKVSSAEIRRQYATVLIVNRGAFRLTLYKDLSVAKTYSIAVGKAGLETPAGLYHIANKAVNPAWHVPNSDWAGDLAGTVIPGDDPSNPIKARWLGVYDGVGVHGTSDDSSIGSAASHGCIRMHIPDVIDLYPRVPVGSAIYIA